MWSQPKPVAGPKPGFHSTNVTDDTWACCLDEQAILHAIEMEATAQIEAERAAAAAAAEVRVHVGSRPAVRSTLRRSGKCALSSLSQSGLRPGRRE